jgi:hypothetical protein
LNCPECNNPIYDEDHPCPKCGLDLGVTTWEVITTVSPPDDAVLESLIQSFGIPVRLIHSLDSVFGLAIGPLGEVKIAVPSTYADKTRELLQAEMEQPQE